MSDQTEDKKIKLKELLSQVSSAGAFDSAQLTKKISELTENLESEWEPPAKKPDPDG
jgi:hypothetical protein